MSLSPVLEISVLYLEDIPTVNKLVSRMLAPRVKELLVGENGQEGWKLFQAHHPDVVISDIMMPEMNGLELAKRIKETRPETQIILTTAYNYSQYLFSAINTGVSRYLLKPVKEDQLFQALESCVKTLEKSGKKSLPGMKPDLQNLFETMSEFVLVINGEGKLLYWNPSVEKRLHYTSKELQNIHSLELHSPSDREEAASLLFSLLSGDKTVSRVPLASKEGEKIAVETRVTRGLWQGEKCLFAVSRDITEQMESERKIQCLVQELRASNEQLEIFAYAASHDLREPLRMIRSYLSLIQKRQEKELSSEIQEYFNFALNASSRMDQMIQGLLRYARLQSFQEQPVPVSLDGVLENARNNLRLRIEESQAILEIPEALPKVMGDPVQLERLFQNLLENALKYTQGKTPKIQVQYKETLAGWEISVRDNGIGIAREDEDKLFQVFTRLPQSDHESNGIGLAECRKIVENHGGKIWLNSQQEEGACFSFLLPFVKNCSQTCQKFLNDLETT